MTKITCKCYKINIRKIMKGFEIEIAHQLYVSDCSSVFTLLTASGVIFVSRRLRLKHAIYLQISSLKVDFNNSLISLYIFSPFFWSSYEANIWINKNELTNLTYKYRCCTSCKWPIYVKIKGGAGEGGGKRGFKIFASITKECIYDPSKKNLY